MGGSGPPIPTSRGGWSGTSGPHPLDANGLPYTPDHRAGVARGGLAIQLATDGAGTREGEEKITRRAAPHPHPHKLYADPTGWLGPVLWLTTPPGRGPTAAHFS